ncbi:MAG: hypothetical protein H7Z39_13160 [Burkholderiaceae bacterium]|nr:hypothetical protein [Burkholderiaceae bacterium]
MNTKTAILTLLLFAFAADLHAEDIALMGGALRVHEKNETSFAAALSYTHPVGEYSALSLTYLNEGHPQDHHRDGIDGQVWLRTKQLQNGLSFGAGVGAYYYFDTARSAPGGYSNDHGWAPIYSVSASWYFPSGWYAHLQANRVLPRSKDDTSQLLLGLGYRFKGVPGNKLHLSNPSHDDTVTLSAGQTIVNSFDSERARAYGVEYRRVLRPYVDWSVSWLKEGGNARTDRAGLATQLWLIRSLSQHVELGVGAGPYIAYDLPHLAQRQRHVSGLVSIVSRYHFNRSWVGQLSWNRVVTDYHRDADVLLLGLGRTF